MRRTARILAALEATRLVAPEALARDLGVSRRTVANEVAALTEDLGEAASVMLVEGRYRLMVADPVCYAGIRRALETGEPSFNDPRTRVSFVVTRLFRALVPVRIDELARAMCVGRTTAVADLARAREVIAADGLVIDGRPNVGLTLKGPELQQRLHILREHFDAAYPDVDSAIRMVCAKVAADFGLKQGILHDLARWATVVVDRVRCGYPIECLPERYAGVVRTQAHAFARQLAGALGASAQVDIGDGDIAFLALPVVGMRALEAESVTAQLSDIDADELVQQILAEIATEMDINLAGADLQKEFARHVALMVNRMRYQMWVDDGGMVAIGDEFPVAYEMATLAARVITGRIGLPVDETEIGFLAAYFQVFLENRRAAEPRRLQVMIVACRGRVVAELLRLQLRKLISPASDLHVITVSEATPDVLADADLVVVIGDAPIQADAPVVHVPGVLDRRGLERQLDRLRLRLPVPSAGGGTSAVLAASLDESHFFALPAGTGYLDGVEYMCSQLEARGLVEEGFVRRIMAREAESQTKLDAWVGFPHATMRTQQTVMLAVGVVRRREDEDGVRLVVLLGVPDDGGLSEPTLIAVYDEVLRLGSRRDLIEGLSRATTYQEFFYYMENHPLGGRHR